MRCGSTSATACAIASPGSSRASRETRPSSSPMRSSRPRAPPAGVARVVLDPGVLVSGLIAPGGTTGRLLDAWRTGAFEVVACPALLAEPATVLARPRFAGISTADRAAVLRQIEIDAWMASDPVDPARRSRDPKDDYLIALADEHSVDALISG